MGGEPLHRGAYAPQLLVHALSRDLERPALHMDDGRVLTAGHIRDLTSSYAQALAHLGVGQGTRIALLSRNRPEVVLTMTAVTLADGCLTSLHPMGSLDDFAYCIEDAAIEVLVFDPDHFASQAEALSSRLSGRRLLLALGPTDICLDLDALASDFPPKALVAPVVDPEGVCRINYSGGTTGKPKGIMNTHRSQTTMLTIMLAEWEWPDEIRFLVCSPLSHAAQAMLIPVLMRNGSLIVGAGFEPASTMAMIERHRATCTMVVPTMVYALLDHPRRADFDLSSLECIYIGSAPISPSRLDDAISAFGPVFFQFYGQTEAPLTVTVMRRAEHVRGDLHRLSACGRSVPWVEVALMGPADAPVEAGSPGEICVRGPLVCAGYLNKPRETAEAFAGGWLHTGDIAVRDGDGFLHIVDRKKDMIITGGFNVYPREVEDVIGEHPAVSVVSVIGVPDDKWGEAVTAYVVLRPGSSVAADALIALVRERKGPIQAPKSVRFVNDLPMSALGKLDKKALRARAAAEMRPGRQPEAVG